MSPLALLFAAVAAGIVWRANRPPAVVSLPSLAGPSLPLPAPVTSAAGVHPLLVAAIVAPWFLVAWLALRDPAPQPAPGPAPAPAAVDLRGAWVGPTAAEDAAITGELLAALATQIEYDGTLAAPRITTGAQAAELRALAREYRTSGVSLASRQPGAIDRIAAYLEQQIGTDGGAIDAAGRKRWVDAFRAVAAACGVTP